MNGFYLPPTQIEINVEVSDDYKVRITFIYTEFVSAFSRVTKSLIVPAWARTGGGTPPRPSTQYKPRQTAK